jgi:hypothetical protein
LPLGCLTDRLANVASSARSATPKPLLGERTTQCAPKRNGEQLEKPLWTRPWPRRPWPAWGVRRPSSALVSLLCEAGERYTLCLEEEYGAEDQVHILRRCEHMFHRRCLDEWLSVCLSPTEAKHTRHPPEEKLPRSFAEQLLHLPLYSRTYYSTSPLSVTNNTHIHKGFPSFHHTLAGFLFIPPSRHASLWG